MTEQGLKDKAVKGVGWSAIDNVAQYAVSFADEKKYWPASVKIGKVVLKKVKMCSNK